MTFTPSDTFTITGYNATTGVATVTFFVGGQTYTGVKVSGCPKDSVANVKQFMNTWVTAYQNGLATEAAKITPVDPTVAALVNTPTQFN